ncbi:hypothetical protein [Methanobacterium sp. SMA-27]|uniref:hypothetical protein n=1 Tax=Methanobacterium sp. SMA-27 TaxID=1495336 RepID=UPI00064EF3BE|nr:hypothetical protein [Methanobacterium sp. SMA-27]
MKDKLEKGKDWFFNQKLLVKLAIIVGGAIILILIILTMLGLVFPDDTPLTGADLEKYKVSCTVISLQALNSNVNKYEGQHVNFTGQIVQINQKDGQTNIVMSVTQVNGGWSNTDLIYVTYKSQTNLKRGDIITVYGAVSGTYNYISVTLGRLVLPKIIARDIELTPLTSLVAVPFTTSGTNISSNGTDNSSGTQNSTNTTNPSNTQTNTVPSNNIPGQPE